jgi:hypothetical protein
MYRIFTTNLFQLMSGTNLKMEKLEKICRQKVNDEMSYAGKFWLVKWKKYIKKVKFDKAASLVLQALQFRIKRNVSQIYYQVYHKYDNMNTIVIKVANRCTFKILKRAYKVKCKIPIGLTKFTSFNIKRQQKYLLYAFQAIKGSVCV